jgi:hypothetical protein
VKRPSWDSSNFNQNNTVVYRYVCTSIKTTCRKTRQSEHNLPSTTIDEYTMDQGNNPPNFPLKALTDPRRIYGNAQGSLAAYLNQASSQQRQPFSQQLLQQFLRQQLSQRSSQPFQQHALSQELSQKISQPLNAGRNVPPSNAAAANPSFESLLGNQQGGSGLKSSLQMAMETKRLLDEARLMNEIEIHRALEEERMKSSQILQQPQSLPQSLPQFIQQSLTQSVQQGLPQSLRSANLPTNILMISSKQSLTEVSSDDGRTDRSASTAARSLKVGGKGITDLRMVQDDPWEARFRELIKFKEEHGQCNVSRRYKNNPKLGVWVCSLRQQMARGTLNKAKIERLNQIGFQWRITVIKGAQINPQIAKADKWNDRFELLTSFKSQNGHCDVPASNRQLFSWALSQRRQLS